MPPEHHRSVGLGDIDRETLPQEGRVLTHPRLKPLGSWAIASQRVAPIEATDLNIHWGYEERHSGAVQGWRLGGGAPI